MASVKTEHGYRARPRKKPVKKKQWSTAKGKPIWRDDKGKWRNKDGSFAPTPKAKKGRKVTKKRSGKLAHPRKPHAKGPSGPLSHEKLLREIVRNFESAGVDLADYDSEERVIREHELWHFYTLEFSDTFDLDHAEDFFKEYIRPVLRPKYRSFTHLKVKVGIFDREGAIIASSWRSISATFHFDDAFDQISFNILKWLRRDEYDTLMGIAVEVRAPRKVEKGRMGDVKRKKGRNKRKAVRNKGRRRQKG